MPRANRVFIPGMVWHITHRCHKKEFLLKFSHDRRRWLRWLFEAKKRYNVTILNYVVTSNHVHLLVLDETEGVIASTIQLAAGRTAQEYNKRKKRKGAFWEDRYHATAIQTGKYLQQCLVYIDLNMVRAGVVDHPSKWNEGGYCEIQNPPERYRIIDRRKLLTLLGVDNDNDFQDTHKQWVDEALKSKQGGWKKPFSQNIAIGNEDFLHNIARKLGVSNKHFKQRIETTSKYSSIREPDAFYSGKNSTL